MASEMDNVATALAVLGLLGLLGIIGCLIEGERLRLPKRFWRTVGKRR